jgi:hypothetical protein
LKQELDKGIVTLVYSAKDALSAKPVLIFNRAALGNCTDEPRKATAAGVQQATKKEPGD